jgi:hypothetical protein
MTMRVKMKPKRRRTWQDHPQHDCQSHQDQQHDDQAEGWGAEEIIAEQIVHDGGLISTPGKVGEWRYPEVVDATAVAPTMTILSFKRRPASCRS